MDINTARRASSAAYWPTDARAVKDNGSLISYMAGAFDNITLNTLARTTNGLAVAGSGLAVIGAIAHIQQLLTETNGPKSLDIATLTTIKSELLTEKDVIASALQTQTKTKQHYIQNIQHSSDPRPDFRKIQKTLTHYTSLIDNTTAAHRTLEDAIDAITKQLSDLKLGHHADIRRHTLEVATDCGSLASAIATTVHHSLNPLGVTVAASTLLLAIANIWETESAIRFAKKEMQRLSALVEEDNSALRPLLESIHADIAQEHAHLLDERYYHCRESLGVTAILGSGIAAMSGLSLANIGLALVGAGTLIANNIIARMRQQPKTALALSLLNEAQGSVNTSEPASETIQTHTAKRSLSPEALRDLSRGKEEHVQLLASYLGTPPSTVRLGLKHCGIERTLKTLGSSGSLPTPSE